MGGVSGNSLGIEMIAVAWPARTPKGVGRGTTFLLSLPAPSLARSLARSGIGLYSSFRILFSWWFFVVVIFHFSSSFFLFHSPQSS